MPKPPRVKLEGYKSVELKLGKTRTHQVFYFKLYGKKVGAKDVVRIDWSYDHSGIYAWWTRGVGVTIPDGCNPRTVVIHAKEQALESLDEPSPGG